MPRQEATSSNYGALGTSWWEWRTAIRAAPSECAAITTGDIVCCEDVSSHPGVADNSAANKELSGRAHDNGQYEVSARWHCTVHYCGGWRSQDVFCPGGEHKNLIRPYSNASGAHDTGRSRASPPPRTDHAKKTSKILAGVAALEGGDGRRDGRNHQKQTVGSGTASCQQARGVTLRTQL